MTAIITVHDETTAGQRSASIELSFPTERITVRELIRERVYQEVQDFNRAREAGEAGGVGGAMPGASGTAIDGGPVFRGLVRPTDAEVALNGFKVPRGKPIDWQRQFERACEAYEQARVLVLVGDRQTESLEETIELTRGVEVTFLKLVPLVGG